MYVLGPGEVIINKNVKSSYSCKCIFPSAIKGLSFLLSLSLGIQCDRIYEEQPTVSNVEDSANSKVDSTNPANVHEHVEAEICLLYTSPSPRDQRGSRMPSSA